MEALLTALIESAPNLILAALILFWMTKVIERLLATQERLIDTLLKLLEHKKPASPDGNDL